MSADGEYDNGQERYAQVAEAVNDDKGQEKPDDDFRKQLQALMSRADPAQRAELRKLFDEVENEVTRVDHLAQLREQFSEDLEMRQLVKVELASVEERLAAGVKAYAEQHRIAAYFDPAADEPFVIGTQHRSKRGDARKPVDYAAVGRALPANAESLKLALDIEGNRVEAAMLRSGNVSWNEEEYADPPAWRREAYHAEGKAKRKKMELPKGNPLNHIKVWYKNEWVAFSTFKNALERGEVKADDLVYPAQDEKGAPLKLAA